MFRRFMVKNVLARTATVVPLSAPSGNIEVPYVLSLRISIYFTWSLLIDKFRAFPFFMDGYNLKSSLVASRAAHDDMLAFAAQNHVVPSIEKFEFSEKGFAEALGKMQSGKLRYRGVLVAA